MPRCPSCAHENPPAALRCEACSSALPSAASPTLQTAADGAGASLTSSSSLHGRFEPGQRLGERYRLVGLLGRGGMGEVYRADDLRLGQSVALKFLPESVASDPRALERFRNEVRTARGVTHPNVCRIHDIGEEDGEVFLSMEHVDGEDLASVLRRMGRPSREKSIEIARQLCSGLAAAHRAGVLHRDLKPGNVMLDGRGRVRITDFGLAGLASELEGATGIEGTPAYMAPEQLSGGGASVQSDLYSLGLLLYELFTGRRAVEGRTVAELKQAHASGSIPSATTLVPDLDPAVERVIERCLEREPSHRPPSAQAVLRALPGGDPLAEILAAGETPSPELIAHAGDVGGLSPRAAVGLFLLAVVGLVAGWQGGGRLYGQVWSALPEDPPAVLRARAADVLKTLGWTQLLDARSAAGFAKVPETVDAEPPAPAAATSAAAESAAVEATRAPPRIVAWRRWSLNPLKSSTFHQPTIKLDDPPVGQAGEALVVLDERARLERLEIEPWPEEDAGQRAAPEVPEVDALFALSGLERSAFEPVPVRAPLASSAPADERFAWVGPWPGEPERRLRVDYGARAGRPVSWRLDWHPGSPPSEALAGALGADGAPSAMGWIILVPAILGVALAWRHWRSGRGDRRGAVRLAGFVALFYWLGGWALHAAQAPTLLAALQQAYFGEQAAHALLHGVFIGATYLVLEPYARRFWPLMLVGWSRLLAGRWRDPGVGREVLIGVAVACACSGGAMALNVVLPQDESQLRMLAPTTVEALGNGLNLAWDLLVAMPRVVLEVVFFMMPLLLLRLLLRRNSFAVGTTVGILLLAFGAQLPSLPNPRLATAMVLLISTSAIVILLRVGLLAFTAFMWTGSLLGFVEVAAPPGNWVLVPQLVHLGLVVALAAVAAWISLAGRSLLGDLLEG